MTNHPIIVHQLKQGSPEWHLYRAVHFNASDAAAMLGCAPHQTRDELKLRLHTGHSADVDPMTQARYDNGHRIEALARPLAEDVLCDDLVPMVVSRGKLSASLDGAVPFWAPEVIAFTRLWEHKQLNDALRAAMVEGATGADLPKPYRVQMEQQLMCTDAEDVLFTASAWDGDTLIEARHVVYVSDPALCAEIEMGWQLLEEEMVSYVPPTAGAIVIARTYAAMPSLQFDVSGDLQIKHNLGVYLQALEAFAAAAPKKPSTDQEFADADSAGKKGREIALVARNTKADLLRRVGSLNEAMGVLDEIEALGDKLGLAQEKVVKLRKEEVKAEMTKAARDLLAAEVDSLNEELGEVLITPVGHVVGEFVEATKNKRSFDSMQASVNEALAALKISYRQRAILLHTNLDTLGAVDGKHRHLFSDKSAIVTKAPDDFAALVKVRCAEFDREEEVRIAAEQTRIREEAKRRQALSDAREAIAHLDVLTKEAAAKSLDALDVDIEGVEFANVEDYAPLQTEARAALNIALRALKKIRAEKALTISQAAQSAQAPASIADAAAAPAPVIAATAPVAAPTVYQMVARAHSTAAAGAEPTVTLGQIGARLGFSLTADFLRSIGFEGERRRAALLFHEHDFALICDALIAHVTKAKQPAAA